MQSLDIDPDAVSVPCVGTQGVGDEGAEEPIEVVEEEEGEDTTDQQLDEEDPGLWSVHVLSWLGEYTYQLNARLASKGWAVKVSPAMVWTMGDAAT